jgi:hypothetical protein
MAEALGAICSEVKFGAPPLAAIESRETVRASTSEYARSAHDVRVPSVQTCS